MKAIIFSTHTGGGHDAAAYAMEQALTQQGVTCKVMDCVAFGGIGFSHAVSGSYVKMVQRHPQGFGKIYRLGEMISTPRHVSPVYCVNTAYAFRMAKELRSYGADFVVSTHMFGGMSMTHLKRRGQYTGLFAMVMTDYTLSPFMEDIKPDVLFVSNRAVMDDCRAKGMPEGILKPFGIPVSTNCVPCTDRAAAKEKLGLSPDAPHVLLVGGSMGAGNLPDTISRLLPELPENARITVVCGTNEEIKREAENEFKADHRVVGLGKVSPLYDLMAGCDVLLTKSGGLTTTEAMTIGTPMVIVNPIVGCETENAKFFERKGLALYARSMAELPEMTARLLNSQTAREQMVEAQHREIDPECSKHIAAYLVDLMHRRTET